MALKITLTPTEREKLGALVNNISIYGAQLIMANRPELSTKALSNLRKLKREQEELIKRVDELARDQNEESPLRLIEDLPKVPSDVAQILTLVRRCLSAGGFLGHLLAQPAYPDVAAEAADGEKRLH